MFWFVWNQAAFALPASQLPDPRQHFCHGGIERAGNKLANFSMTIERTRQRRRFQNRYAVLFSDLPNAQGNVTSAFGNHFGALILPSSYCSATE